MTKYADRKKKEIANKVADVDNTKRLICLLEQWKVKGSDDSEQVAWNILPIDLQQWLTSKSKLSRQFYASRPLSYYLDKMFAGNVALGSAVTMTDALKKLDYDVVKLAKLLRGAETIGYKITATTHERCDGSKTTLYTIVGLPKEV